MRFAGESGQIECEHCGTQYETGVIEQIYADKEQAAASAGTEPRWDTSMAGSGWGEEEASHMRGYSCPSCAAEIICDDTTAATSCLYCGNPTVVPGQFSGQLKPDYVIPFKLDKNHAIEALKKHYSKKKFLPKSFADANHLEEIKGVYVPFWLYDADTDAYMRFRATKMRSYTRGDYRITETDHYRVVREGTVAFAKVPVDASTKMPDAHMDAVEPYEYAELREFSSAYLPGFFADKYDQDAEACSKRANERITVSTEDAFTATAVGYTSLTREYSNIQLKRGDVRYAMLPVWMLSTKWKDKNFLFAMNGQTGKLIGDLPVDWQLFWMWFAGIFAVSMTVFSLIAVFLL
ncbi:MAG: hypothetical protein FWH01_14520 [Oscillospiraceae bacterium]|nr:hypothetical protein [Oscillospiraceae bacterium]